MTWLPKRYVEDKAMRDAAKLVLDADIAHFKEGVAEQGIVGRLRSQMTNRVKTRVKSGASDAIDQAKSAAEDNPGLLAALVGALMLWLARKPLLGLLGLGDDAETDTET